MRRTLWIVAVLAAALSGCVSTKSVALEEHLDYAPAPVTDQDLVVTRPIMVLPFVDNRPLDGAAESDSPLLNLVPLVWSTTRVDPRPEKAYGLAGGCFRRLQVQGSLAEAIPKLLVEQLKSTGRAPKAQYVGAVEGGGLKEDDVLLRGVLVSSTLTTDRFSYCLGPLGFVPQLLGLPSVRRTVWLEVSWQLCDAKNNVIGVKRTASVEVPITQYAGCYYGRTACGKRAPLGLYVEAVRRVNQKIAEDISKTLAR